ncbi:hypothetical protein Hanom_Chr03g00202181 [Helianthus anomalus]
MLTAVEKKKLRIKRKAVQTGVIPRNVRAKKAGATMPEGQSGKSEKHMTTSKGPKTVKDQHVEVPEVPEIQSVENPEVQKKAGADDNVVITNVRVSTPPPLPENPEVAESLKLKKTVLPGLFEGFPNIQGEFKDDIISGEEFDMVHDAPVKHLKKKMSLPEKEKEKAKAERDELKKQLEELSKEEEVDEELKDVLDAVDNYDPSWDDFIDKEDDDDQGSTGLLIVNPSVQQKIDDFMNDEINEQEEDHHQESSSSGKKHADQVFLTQPTVIYLNAPFEGELEVPRSRADMLEELGLDDGKFKFDIEDEIPSSPEKEYEFKYAHEADNYNDVIVEEGSDSSDEDKFFIILELMKHFLHLLKCSRNNIKRKLEGKLWRRSLLKIFQKQFHVNI